MQLKSCSHIIYPEIIMEYNESTYSSASNKCNIGQRTNLNIQ